MAEVPVLPSRGALRPLGVDEVRLGPGFWGDRQALNGSVVIGHCLDWMSRMGWVGNFSPGAERQGREFSDSEIYKLAEAMVWESARSGSEVPALDELTSLVVAAQEPDGYLNTRFGPPGLRYTDLEWGHELYCYGFLIQAAVARLRTFGEDDLVRAARRAADHIWREFGPDGRPGVCGHPEIEMALVELFRATQDERYLEQARLFVERRGRPALSDIEFGRAYYQDDMPVRRAPVLRGHAVRALFLACGAVDLAVETGDDELLEAVLAQWERTVATRTYLTGGMGSRHYGEAFGDDFELPPDRAYAETCAGVASVMLAWRLLLATGDTRYADLAERTLYNVVATSPALDGRAFFYSNTLHQRVPGTPPEPDQQYLRPQASVRAPWFSVSCCPNNVARTLASLAGYVATTDANGIQLHQLANCTIRTELPGGRRIGLRVETDYPWSGAVTVRVEEAPGGFWQIGVRIPPWAADGKLRPGLMTTERSWRPGDELRVDLPVHPRWTYPDPRIDAVRGCVAVERGPLVYCAESAHQDTPLDTLNVDTSVSPTEDRAADLAGAVTLTLTARQAKSGDPSWPYGPTQLTLTDDHTPLTLIPYHLWGNRGPATMRIWLPDHAQEQP